MILFHFHCDFLNCYLPGIMLLFSCVNYKLALSMGACHTAAADLQHPVKEFRVESRNEAFCAGGCGGGWQDRSSDSSIFSGADFLSLTLESPHIEKSTKMLHGDD